MTSSDDDPRPILAVGWDVGGWLGKNQAVAVVQPGDRGLEWLGRPSEFRLAPRESGPYHGMPFVQLIQQAWPGAGPDVLERYRVVLAIDAPLGLPLAWQQLFAGERPDELPVRQEIDSPLAYRETDRWVQCAFEKKPLSATFDRLGNNASVGNWHLQFWAAEVGLAVAPREVAVAERPVAIEVYPALVKCGVPPAVHRRFGRLLTPGLASGSHAYDAAICAVHALAFALDGDREDLPVLTGPPETFALETLKVEGWIYSIPPDWFKGAG